MADATYPTYVDARKDAWDTWDRLVSEGLGKDEIYAHPDYQAAVAREQAAYRAHLEAEE